MNIQRISNLQLMFLIISFIFGSVFYFSFIDGIAHHDSWLAIIAGYLISLPIILSFAAISKSYPNKNLIQISDSIFGSYIGKVISFLYCLFFFWQFMLDLKEVGIFYTSYIMPETPMPVFIIIFALTSGYAVKKGIEVIARISSIIVFYGILITVLTFLLLLRDMDFSNFLPIFDIPMEKYIQSAHIIMAIHFSGIIVFLPIMSFTNNSKKLTGYVVKSVTIGAIVILAISIRNTSVLGPSSAIYLDASYQAVRQIDIGDILTRVELVIALGLTISLFIRTCVLFYATVSCFSQLLRLNSYHALILPIGGIAVIIGLIVHGSSIGMFNDATNYYPFLVFPFEVIFPLLSLLITKIRYKGKYKKDSNVI